VKSSLAVFEAAIWVKSIQYNTIKVIVPSLQNMAYCALQCQ